MLGFVLEVQQMAEAKLGDKCSRKALSVLTKRGLNYDGEVHEKTDGSQGQWFCIDCGELPMNNMQAQSHAGSEKFAEFPKHRMAWRNFESSKLEVP